MGPEGSRGAPGGPRDSKNACKINETLSIMQKLCEGDVKYVPESMHLWIDILFNFESVTFFLYNLITYSND